jgi:hypothetical protein
MSDLSTCRCAFVSSAAKPPVHVAQGLAPRIERLQQRPPHDLEVLAE